MRVRCWLAVLFGVWSLTASAGDCQVRGLMVDDRLPAGNIVFEKAEGDTVYVRQDVRDTKGSWSWGWFYWGMRVRGAAGRTLTFRFTHGDVVGARGPVVSLDRGRTFAYPLDGRTTKTGFTYTFADDADEVWFYECHPYVRADWDAFVAAHKAELGTAFVVETLCWSRRGADVPRARFGCIAREPCYRILMTARHHCSETMASWVLEGVAEAFLADDDLGRWLRDNVELMMVPMVDYDGVQAGDQGKNRVPHDHNRDYTEFIYPETKAITGWIASHAGNRLDAFIDVHCPFIRGDDHLYTPWKDPKLPYMNPGNERRFSRILEQMQCGSMRYKASDDLQFGREWNKGINYDQGWSAIIWALNRIPTLRVARSYEVPFANANGAVVTPETCRDLGRDTAKVFRAFFADGGVSAGKESADGLALASNDFVRCCRRMTGAREPSARFAVDPSLDAVHDEYRIVSEGDGLRVPRQDEAGLPAAGGRLVRTSDGPRLGHPSAEVAGGVLEADAGVDRQLRATRPPAHDRHRRAALLHEPGWPRRGAVPTGRRAKPSSRGTCSRCDRRCRGRRRTTAGSFPNLQRRPRRSSDETA